MYSSTISFEKLYGPWPRSSAWVVEPLQGRPPRLADVERQQLVDRLGALAPQVPGSRRGVHDRAAVGHAVEQALRQRAQCQVVDGEDGVRGLGVGDAGVVEQRVHWTVKLRDRGAHRTLVGQVGSDERVVRSVGRREVEDRHVLGVELGEHVEQGRTDAARSSGDDGPTAGVGERLGHGVSPSR